MMTIRSVRLRNRAFWRSLDPHLSEEELLKKARNRQGLVLLVDDVPAGLLRWNLPKARIP